MSELEIRLDNVNEANVEVSSSMAEFTIDTESLLEGMKSDPDILAGIAMPEVFEYCWPTVFVSIWFWVTGLLAKKRDFSKIAVGLPRGFGKTTVVKILCLYAILFTNKKFILILSATKDHACNIIADVMDMLKEPNIKGMFGDWKLGAEIDRQDVKKFSFRGRTIIIAGVGSGGTVRGLNLKNSRPDFMIFEDVQSREDADSEPISEGLFNWIVGTAMKAKSPKGCLTMFIANMYPTPFSILKRLVKNSQWVKWIAGGILADPVTGELTSLWEDLQPLEQLLDELRADTEAGKAEIFYSEVLNDPNANVNTKVDVSKIPRWEGDETWVSQGKFIIIDPSGEGPNADDVSIGCFGVYDAIPVLTELDYGKMNPLATVWGAINMACNNGAKLIIVEGNAYQATLGYWIRHVMAQIQLEGISVMPIFSGRNSKNSRIVKMFRQLVPEKKDEDTQLMIADNCRAAVINQITQFNALKTKNTDGILDLLTYAPRVLLEFQEFIESGEVIEMQMSEADSRLLLENNMEMNMSPI